MCCTVYYLHFTIIIMVCSHFLKCFSCIYIPYYAMLVMLYAYTFATTFATNTFPSFNHLSEEATHTFLIRVVVNRKVIQVFRDEEMVRTDRIRFKKKRETMYIIILDIYILKI